MIKFKRGKWYVIEEGKDYVVFDTEEEALEYTKPKKEPKKFTWDIPKSFEEI